MWRVYCPTSESVAIRTTLGRLYDSLPDRVELLGVRYDPAPAEIFGPIHLWLISQKRAAFEYESEIRAVVPAPPLQGELVSGRAGEQIDWDPSRHIASVTVHPEADAAFVQTVRGAVTALAPALTSVIETSALAIGPETAWRDNGTE